MLRAIHPLPFIDYSIYETILAFSMLQALLVAAFVPFSIWPLVLAFSMHEPQLPFTFIDLSVFEGDFTISIAVAIVERAFVYGTIGEVIVTFSKFFTVHELPLIGVISTGRKELFLPFPMREVFTPPSFILVPGLGMFVDAFALRLKVHNIPNIVGSRREKKDAIGGVAAEKTALEVGSIRECHTPAAMSIILHSFPLINSS